VQSNNVNFERKKLIATCPVVFQKEKSQISQDTVPT